MTCNATPPGYADMPPRCGHSDGHLGPHRAAEGIVVSHKVDPGDEWANEADVAEPSRWRRVVRRAS